MIRTLFVVLLVALSISSAIAEPAALPVPQSCLPPGLPADVFEWPVVATERGFLQLGEHLVPGFLLRYEYQKHAVVVLRTIDALLLVDPAPDDPDSPVWINAGRVDVRTGMLRAEPVPMCQWVRPPPADLET